MRKNLFARYNLISVVMIIIGSCFTGTIIMYFIEDYNEYNALQSKINIIMRNVFDDMEINSEQTFESSLKDNFKLVSTNNTKLILFDKEKDIIYSDLEPEYVSAMELDQVVDKLEHNGEYKDKKSIKSSRSNKNCHLYGRELSSYFSESTIKYLTILSFENNFASVYKMIGLNFIFALACVVCFSILILVMYTFYISKPLREMNHVITEYERGNFKAKVEVKTRDDIGKLAQTMNKMSYSIEKFEESSKNFVANVSHEFKTPITSISGFVDGILDGTIPEEKRAHYLKIVSSEVKRLSNLVHSMLNISKIESGGVKPVLTPINIGKIIKIIVENFVDKIESKDLRIKGIDKIENYWVEGDKILTHQVFYNLIENAIKFANDGGYILFGAFRISNFLTVRIQNSGDGLTESEKKRLFERFYKTDKSRGRDKSGFGLGLNIVLTIVRLCGWKINVNSEYGKYTEFVLSLKTCPNPNLNQTNENDEPSDSE